MITHIRMKNFKSWKDSGNVKLTPLTGFFGTNSSGKSSLLQMLLLLKQTIENKEKDDIIFFGIDSSYVNLGNFREVIHGHKVDTPLVFQLECKLTHSRSLFEIQQDSSAWEQKIEQFAYESIFRIEEGEFILDKFSYASSLGKSKKLEYSDGRVTFYHHIGDLSIHLNNCYGMLKSGTSKQQKYLKKFASAFEEQFSHVYYLGPSRVHPQRDYNWQGIHPGHSGQWGDRTIDALLSARVRKLNTLHKTEEVPIEQRISDWLQEMELAHSFSLNWIEAQGSTTYEVRIQKTSSSPPVTLVDMGYGLSQFLPVLVLCYYAPEGSTLILEQPGIHLHPKVQSQLADLLIEVVNERKLQILVESHSEHLLTRIQRRIVEKQIESNDVALYFCRNDGGTSTIDKLDVDEESGDIKNWPENFFGDVMGDMFAMTDKQVERIAENEPEE